MGGAAKGLLLAPDGDTIVARWTRLFRGLGVPFVLVASEESAPAYRAALPDAEIVLDQPSGTGPIGGLAALFARAAAETHVVTVACDMPLVDAPLLERLLVTPASTAVLAAKTGDRFQPFFARWAVGPSEVALRRVRDAGRRSMTAVLEAAGVTELVLEADVAERLADWDTPEDVRGYPRSP